MTTAYARRGKPSAGRTMAALFHRLQLTLFHAGTSPHCTAPAADTAGRVTGWVTVTPGFTSTAHRYLEQVTVSLRPSTVKRIEHDLRQFGCWLRPYPP